MSFSLKVRATVVGVLLAVFFGLSAHTAWEKSNTWDEPAHLLAGYSYVAEGMDYISPLHHPATGRAIGAALPAILLDLDFRTDFMPEQSPRSDFYLYTMEFLHENTTDARVILFLGRLGVILIGLLLGVFVYLWSRELWGDAGAFLSLFLFALSPNIIAHTSIITTDLAITAFFFITCFYLYRTIVAGVSVWRVLGAGIFFGLALTTKHTALLLIPIGVAAFILSGRFCGWKRAVAGYAGIIIIAYVAIWAVYGFRYNTPAPHYRPLYWDTFNATALTPVIEAFRSARLLPEAYLYSISGVFQGMTTGRDAFLMGSYSTEGWWYYFIVAFFIKTPLATIFLLAAAVAYIFGRYTEHRRYALLVIVPALLVFALVSSQKVNIGLRHILPVYPFIFTLIGFVPLIRNDRRRIYRGIFAIALIWYVWAGLSIHPHHLAYFNEAAGGPKNGHKFLVDSNLDWGQDLRGLKEFMDANDIETIKLAYFGLSDPAYYGIEYEQLPGYFVMHPRPQKDEVELKGWFAISATLLEGMYLADRDLYAAFRETEPVARIGHTIYVYKF